MYTLLLINFFNKDEMSWQEILTQNNYRITQPRVRIMELLQDAALPLTPQQIHAQLLAQGCDLGLVSVYRTLDLLAQLELVAIVYDPERNPGYVISSAGHHHHIVCQQCHQALEFSGSDDIDELIQRVEAETAFQVRDHLLQLYGICPGCQSK
jgi:Fur family ferric uptake transcriptional regulator